MLTPVPPYLVLIMSDNRLNLASFYADHIKDDHAFDQVNPHNLHYAD